MFKILDQINSPDDLKTLSMDALNLLAVDIRQFLIDNISKTGGHLSSNLGAVELTIALHYVFNSPEDKFIWDVGHQAYVHKILTGRKEAFESLRQYGGLSGFLKRKESAHDCFEAGHSSTSLSAAVGIALARDLNEESFEIIPIIGDGALTGGMALEALNYLGHCQKNVKVILNDNEMSISENVGGISNALSRIRAAEAYHKLKIDTKSKLSKIPNIGEPMIEVIGRLKDSFKYFVVDGGLFFEEIGLTYFGPINGHNIQELTRYMELIKNTNGPVILHVVTRKGKGYEFSEEDPNIYHGVGRFDPNIKIPKKAKNDYSNAFGVKLTELAKDNKDIVAISAAMIDGTGLNVFKETFPKRIFDVGIAEQHAVTMAAGLANQGKKPFVAIYSTFLQRAYDQIFHDVCLQNYPVVFCIDRAGLVGNDGETHHGVFDISYLAHLPNMRIFAPKDKAEFEMILEFAAKDRQGPIAIRYPRGEAITLEGMAPSFEPQKLRRGKKILVLSTGKMTDLAIKAIDACENVKVGLVHVPQIKPLNEVVLMEHLTTAEKIYTLEDHALVGGFGDQINRLILQNRGQFSQVPEVVNLGYDDSYVTQGDTDQLLDYKGLSSDALCQIFRKG